MSSQTPTAVLVDELKALRDGVTGLSESLISTADGLLVAADTETVHPESAAALSAAMLGLGRHAAAEAGVGGLCDIVTRCHGGYVVVMAIGEQALLTVMGDEGLDLATLYQGSPAMLRRLGELLGVVPVV
ncbi:roadblock/LC7 domain-containing protein [Kitasatospora sp. NPDC001574]